MGHTPGLACSRACLAGEGGPLSATFLHDQQGARMEVEPLGLQLVPIWDAGAQVDA